MAQTVRLDDAFIADAKIHASAAHRSLPKQIEYWSKIGMMVEDNPDLPFSFIKEVMLAAEQVKEGHVTRHVRRTARN
ncbi:MAG: TA system antitoxin ParD family protein [Aeromonas sp.]